jgi:superfamily I DNA/RNA helicase
MDLDNMIPDTMKEGSTEKLPGLIWSPMQQAIYDAVENTDDNLSVEAVAGSGKTTTLLKAMSLVQGRVLFLAFSRAIAQELAARTPMGTDCKTFNGLGHGLLKRKTTGRLDKWKLSKMLKPQMSSREYRDWGYELIKLVGSIKGSAFLEPLDPISARSWVEHSDIPMDRIDYAAMLLLELFVASLDVTDTFTFDDQLYMPIFWDMAFPHYDTVFVDEAQDLNAIQHSMLHKLAERGARIIAVGDSRQAIYGFRGALTNSMQKLGNQFETTELPLSVCYRCDRTIVERAKKIVPEIQWRDGADEGTITHLEEGIAPEDIHPASIVMCRTNAPMFRYAVQFLKARVPCMVMSNFGEQLIKFVKNFDVTSTEDLAHEIEIWRKKEIAEAESRELYHKINRINDKAQSILPFCKEFKIKAQVVQALERLLHAESGPRLCTIHKAKGLEADYAYLLRPDLVPGPWIPEDSEEFKQEENLKYVAITRAAHNLVFMGEYEDE